MKVSSALLVANTLLLIFIWVYTGIEYGNLPEIVPTHFAVNGNVDGESEKKAIWFLPAIATFLYLLMVGIPGNPDSPLLNVPESYRNKETLKILMYSILLPVLLLLSDTIVESILIAQGRMDTMSNAPFVLLTLLFIVIGIHVLRMFREKNKKFKA